MHDGVLVAGAGIGGLAAALALGRGAAPLRLVERSPVLAEAGAGIQLGPNATRVLHGWGLAAELARVAAFPERLQVRDAASGRELGVLRLEGMARRYGAPYTTLHRADLQQLLVGAAAQAGVVPELGRTCRSVADEGSDVRVRFDDGGETVAGLVVGADGLWSAVRRALLADGPPRPTGHVAYRCLLEQARLPAALRSGQVTVWLGPKMHIVQYPVRGGAWINVVAIVHAAPSDPSPPVAELANWSQPVDAADVRTVLAGCCTPLGDLLAAAEGWRKWVLCDRPPMEGPGEHGAGRIVLVGDAAHPMRPYLAQGAGMAIEDAAALADVLRGTAGGSIDRAVLEERLRAFAERRWRRNRRVQRRARRNGRIFHASGVVRMARDAAMRLLGERLLDMPWLYRG